MTAQDFPTPDGRTERHLGVEPAELELTIVETPRHDWATRGVPGDELALPHRVDV